MEPNYWLQAVTEMHGTEIKSSLRSCCKKQLFMLFSLGTRYFLETVWCCKFSICTVHNCCLFSSWQHEWLSSNYVSWFYSNRLV